MWIRSRSDCGEYATSFGEPAKPLHPCRFGQNLLPKIKRLLRKVCVLLHQNTFEPGYGRMMVSSGTVREWHHEHGWGIVDCTETPGGASTQSSAVRVEGVADLDGALPRVGLRPGTLVKFDWTSTNQPVNGCNYMVTAVWLATSEPPPGRTDQAFSRVWDSFGTPGSDGLTAMLEVAFDDENLESTASPTLSSTSGTVRRWEGEEGWGVLDSEDTPGGAWAHYSEIIGTGFRTLTPGQVVRFEIESHGHDGYDYRASNIETI